MLNINYLCHINNGPKIYETLIATSNIYWRAIYFLNILPEIFLFYLKLFYFTGKISILPEKKWFGYWKKNYSTGQKNYFTGRLICRLFFVRYNRVFIITEFDCISNLQMNVGGLNLF